MTRTQHPDPSSLCCESMQAALEMDCEDHDDPFECPDSLIAYNKAFNQFGLIVHDGGTSVILIRHCPWCGAALGSLASSQTETSI